MAGNAHKIASIHVDTDSMLLDLRTDRLNHKLNLAQFKLDSEIMTSMVPFMPMQDGTFINITKAMSAARAGSGEVVAAAPPFGRFLYEGKVMVGIRSRSAWAQKGEKKVTTGKNLTYSNGRESHWFDAAKSRDKAHWVKVVEDAMK